jgi:hypothetical protein
VAPRRRDEGGQGTTSGRESAVASGEGSRRAQGVSPHGDYSDDRLAQGAGEPETALTLAERLAIEARRIELQDHWDRVHEKLLLDAQACARAMENSPMFGAPGEWGDIVSRSLEDYRTGRSLMDHLGAGRLLDPATTSMLLAIRRGLIEETGAATVTEILLIDMAVVAYADAMRVQSIVGNTALMIEGEFFGQPSLRAKWKRERGGRPEEIRGLAVDEHVALLRDRLMPLVERFHRLGRESLEALGRVRQAPSLAVERSDAITISLV